ncbi:ATP-dependent DNA helicase [Marinobacter shengliensis]|uniref:ATP-dependent DNA helicase n=1 Tax=Marinobacter shengliensis TaxID=1389223 RepID=UPI001E377E33|nr:AAA family ATPase [Marinobacter shengliensis]MCD1628497.1 AAA family ATPase [Marinobacter shengliensis]
MGAALQLTSGQQAAYEDFSTFLADDQQQVFVLEGFAGTGKSTLVEFLLGQIPKIFRTLKLVNPQFKGRDVMLTATTNKAAETFEMITKQEVRTIQSVLGLRVQTDYRTGKSQLIPAKTNDLPDHKLIIIDEASYVDSQLLDYVFKRTKNCKIMFIGDPAQLSPVKSSSTPVFNAGFPTAKLTEVVRQAKGNPIIELSTMFRETVMSGEFFSFKPDGKHIQWLPRDQFEDAIVQEFTDPTWNDRRSKVLAWTNKTVIGYNQAIHNLTKGSTEFHDGDYAVCNAFIHNKNCQLRTGQMTLITEIVPAQQHGVDGYNVEMDHRHSAFLPASLDAMKVRLNQAKAEDDYTVLVEIQKEWIDLRAAYACTINKSQGSTYDKVFIDLDDLKRCNNPNTLARLLYVAVSRARYQVIFTGDLV